MDKQPLYSIDALFQQKLEELPVDASQQQAQWMSLSKTIHKKPNGFKAQLQKPAIKLLYMTVVALVPFAVFYVSHQQAEVSKDSSDTLARVTRSLKVLDSTKMLIQINPERIGRQAVAESSAKSVNHATQLATSTEKKDSATIANTQLSKNKDSLKAASTKLEKPVTKKADSSSYIYWQ